jgi:hypothetical protein
MTFARRLRGPCEACRFYRRMALALAALAMVVWMLQ